MIGNDKERNKDYNPFNSETTTRKLTKAELKKYSKCNGDESYVAKQYNLTRERLTNE